MPIGGWPTGQDDYSTYYQSTTGVWFLLALCLQLFQSFQALLHPFTLHASPTAKEPLPGSNPFRLAHDD